jgi:hypothetical protein
MQVVVTREVGGREIYIGNAIVILMDNLKLIHLSLLGFACVDIYEPNLVFATNEYSTVYLRRKKERKKEKKKNT